MLRSIHFSIIVLLLGFLPLFSQAQTPTEPAVQMSPESLSQLQPELDALNAERLKLNKTGMIVLGSWAVANIGYSGVQMGRTSGSTRAFHQMNVAWNGVNLAIAGLGYWGSHRTRNKQYDLTGTVKEQKKIELSLMLNTGLDVGYMAFGLYLRERSSNELGDRRDQFRGWGNSLILQGGFLFVYDLTMSVLHQRHGNKGIMKVLDRLYPAPGGLGLSIPLN